MVDLALLIYHKLLAHSSLNDYFLGVLQDFLLLISPSSSL